MSQSKQAEACAACSRCGGGMEPAGARNCVTQVLLPGPRLLTERSGPGMLACAFSGTVARIAGPGGRAHGTAVLGKKGDRWPQLCCLSRMSGSFVS